MVKRQPVLGESWNLVGREPLLREIEESAAAGSGIVLCGPSGVGKTRLVREALKRLDKQGWRVEWTMAMRAASAIPFGVMSHLLPEDGRDMPGVLRSKAGQFAGVPTVIAVDDAHLLDPMSAMLIHHPAIRAEVFLLVTVRYGEPCLDAVTALWKEGLAKRIELPPLTDNAIDDMLEQAFAGALDDASRSRLTRVSAGNPLLLRETLRAGLDTGALRYRHGAWRWEGLVRPTMRLVEVMSARLGAMTGAVARVVELAAWGEPLPAQVLARLCDAESLAAAESTGLLVVETTERRALARLAHPLYGEMIRSTTPWAKNVLLVGELAAAFSATPMRRRDDALRVGVWRLRAGGRGDPGILLAAAKQALRRFDVTLAARLATAARDCGGGWSAEHMLARILSDCGWYEESVRALPEEPADAAGRVRWAIARADILCWGQGRVEDAERTLEEAGTAPGQRRAEAYRSLILMFDSRCSTSRRLSEQVLDWTDAEPQAVVWAAIGASVSAGVLGDDERAQTSYEHGLAMAVEHEDTLPWGRVQVGCAYCMALLAAGRVEEAWIITRREYKAAVRAEIPEPLGVWAGFHGVVAKARGDLAGASRLLRESLMLLSRYDTFRLGAPCLAALAGVHALQAEGRHAARLIARVDGPNRRASRLFLPWIELDRAWTHAACGDSTAAAAAAGKAANLARGLGQPAIEAWALYDAARLGDAGAVHHRLANLANTVGGPAPAAFARAAAALAADDARQLDRTAGEFHALGLRVHAAEAAAIAEVSHRRAGRPGEANKAALRGAEFARLCPDASTPLLEAAIRSSALTRRERDIARLAAGGKSSRRIAELLSLSPRTVDNHLSRAYTKLGVRGRAELPASLDNEPPHRA